MKIPRRLLFYSSFLRKIPLYKVRIRFLSKKKLIFFFTKKELDWFVSTFGNGAIETIQLDYERKSILMRKSTIEIVDIWEK